MKPFWANRNSETEKPVRDLLTKEMTMFQYTHGITVLQTLTESGRIPIRWTSTSSIVLGTPQFAGSALRLSVERRALWTLA